MLGILILIILLGIDMGYMIYCLRTKELHEEKKYRLRVSLFIIFLIFAILSVIKWGFQWNMLFLVLFLKAIISVYHMIRKNSRKEKIYNKKYVIMSYIGSSLLLVFAVFPVIVFPQSKPIERTGAYEVKTVSYTISDPARLEAFAGSKENRKVTIQFWYPEVKEGKYPLVVFSHGAFGYRGSNRSMYGNLASNGYVVCSIDHTYHAFFTKQTDGKMVIANTKFMNDVMAATNGDYDAETTYELSQEWLKLRKGDMNLVLDDILKQLKTGEKDSVYQLIDQEHIGVLGHSLGGATAAAIGRERKDIDAVIVLDGTMFGEETGFSNGSTTLNKDPYPVPLLNLYNEDHYKDAEKLGESYPNLSAAANAIDSRQIVFRESGHLNFTDLPIFSPLLASLLGTGEVDSRYMIETMNQVVLDYFNYYLKDSKELELLPEY